MHVKIYKSLAQALGVRFLKSYGVDTDSWRWHDDVTIDLSQYSTGKLLDLKNELENHPAHRGSKLLIKDILIWMKASQNAEATPARNANQFFAILQKYMLEVAGQRLYRKDEISNTWYCYYVHKLSYTPPNTHRDYRSPGYVRMHAVAVSLGDRTEKTTTWDDHNVEGNTAPFLLARQGWYPETEELRQQYLDTMAKYELWHDQVGKQFWASGEAREENEDDTDRYWWRRTIKSVRLEKNGEPTRVLIDVFKEGDVEERDRDTVRVDNLWWHKIKAKMVPDEEGDMENDRELLADLASAESEGYVPEIPIHPLLMGFDLKRHVRLKLHVEQLQEYVYNKALGERLILPEQDRALVDILLAHKSTFADVVSGKGGGSVVLCTGAPGLGKTLTSEIYAEVAERPLYTIQCSQLGTEAGTIEGNLLKSFVRAERWNAILQLDEADVYIRRRGDDLEQNAIVGVFLRTMEYYRGVMFMTTNRPDLVDDAIASRCVARIDYQMPTAEAQTRMWALQASLNGVTIKPSDIKKIVSQHSDCSGRDIKNIVKLALLFAEAKGLDTITPETVSFVKRFKPTGSSYAE